MRGIAFHDKYVGGDRGRGNGLEFAQASGFSKVQGGELLVHGLRPEPQELVHLLRGQFARDNGARAQYWCKFFPQRCPDHEHRKTP